MLELYETRTISNVVSGHHLDDLGDLIDAVRRWVDDASRIVALTFAGISTESGIPDFRGPQGVWTRDAKAERLSNMHYYMSDPSVRKLAWQGRVDHPAWHAKPDSGHRALVALERRGKNVRHTFFLGRNRRIL
jgi:NAD-dependent SIR2 family protein deacetylase